MDDSIARTVERHEPTSSARNGRWVRDELILALDMYMRHRDVPLNKGGPELVELSQVLGRLGKVLREKQSSTYRNPNGVYMKLMNFRHHDPEYTSAGKTGLARGNKDEILVWGEFAHDPVRLAQVATSIRDGIEELGKAGDVAEVDDPDLAEAQEGRVLTRLHKYRERDRRLVAQAKANALALHGTLSCIACNFNFTDRYGEAGAGVIDVHHTKPLHAMEQGQKTKVTDLALLCSNCHRIIHSRRPWLSIEEVRAMLIN